MNGKYDAILELPHHVSKTHRQMSRQDRAAQFAPFAALSGYDSAIQETARITDDRIELGEEMLLELNTRLQMLSERIQEAPIVSITYFEQDKQKGGGVYLTASGVVRRINDFDREILLDDGTRIKIDDIVSIQGEVFAILHD